MHSKSVDQHSNLLASLSSACAGLPSQSSPYCCCPYLMQQLPCLPHTFKILLQPLKHWRRCLSKRHSRFQMVNTTLETLRRALPFVSGANSQKPLSHLGTCWSTCFSKRDWDFRLLLFSVAVRNLWHVTLEVGNLCLPDLTQDH